MKCWLQKLINRTRWTNEEQKLIKQNKPGTKQKQLKSLIKKQAPSKENKFKLRFGDKWQSLNLYNITPEQQTKYCLECPLPECINCFSTNA